MQNWIPDISAAKGPKYLAIAEALARDVASGRLAAGDRLPPQRTLADALEVDLTTVTRAYSEAQRLGLIQGDGRRGSFVRMPENKTANISYSDPGDLGMNAPPEAFGGSLAMAFRKSVTALLASPFAPAPFQYQQRGGSPAIRQAGVELLGARGLDCEEDTVLIAAGGQHALHAIFSAELQAGDMLAVCQFVYPGLLSLARRYGVELRVIESDRNGMCPAALDAACAAAPIRAVYLVPTNDNPTTRTMDAERRQSIATVIERHGLMLIEDDAYGFLPEEPLPPIAAILPEQSWYIASVSKILTPGLRMAWLRAPHVGKAWGLAADMHETAVMAPPLNAAVVGDWVRGGTFFPLVREIREEARARQQIARECLPADSFQSHEDGYHLWVALGAGSSVAAMSDALRPHGMSIISSEAFAADGVATGRAMRVSIGGTLSRERLRRGLTLLAALNSPDASRKLSLI